jgi:hypothetical protein
MCLSFHSFPGRVPGRNEEVRGQDLEDLKGEFGVRDGMAGELPPLLTPPVFPSISTVLRDSNVISFLSFSPV